MNWTIKMGGGEDIVQAKASEGCDLVITSQAGKPSFADYKPGKVVLTMGGSPRPALVVAPDATTFFTPDGKEILRLEADGSILVRGERTYAKDVVDGLRAWLDAMGLLAREPTK
jgi:hypothetical protein